MCYRQGDTELEGYLVYDNAITGKRWDMLLHWRDGMSVLTRKSTEMIVKLGYVVFAAPKNTAEQRANMLSQAAMA